jgi:membrane protein
VWFGAFVTAVLFVIGKFGIGLYLSMSEIGSAYGAAGALIIILAWIYYSALILFFGAELTQVRASMQGRAPKPGDRAKAGRAKKISARPSTHAAPPPIT